MKRLFLLLLLIGPATVVSSTVRAGTVVFDYGDFGPQSAVYEWIGYEWYQWESHGDSDPDIKAKVKVVVYWEEELEGVKKNYPVVPGRKKDYRYLEYGKAIALLAKVISEFEAAGLDTKRLMTTRRVLKDMRYPGD